MKKFKVFVIMPFADEFFEVYEMLKKQFEEKFEFSNAGDEGNQQNILKDIIQPIYETDIVIADLTGLNPNVLYELGIAHSFNKKVIIITQEDILSLPFDLKSYRAKEYTTHFKKFAELIDYLDVNLNGAISGDVIYSNPVKDFLIMNDITNIVWFNEARVETELDGDDKGYIDFIADIEDDMDIFAQNIQKITSNLDIMSNGIDKSSNEIERVTKNSGSGNAAFVRKESKKAAKHIDEFSQKFETANKENALLWNKIEKNILGLLENEMTTEEKNREALVEFLKSLKTMQSTISTTNSSVEKMSSSATDLLGLERTLNQAIKFFCDDSKTYIVNMEQVMASIEKILNKSKLVVGTIEFDQLNEVCPKEQ